MVPKMDQSGTMEYVQRMCTYREKEAGYGSGTFPWRKCCHVMALAMLSTVSSRLLYKSSYESIKVKNVPEGEIEVACKW